MLQQAKPLMPEQNAAVGQPLLKLLGVGKMFSNGVTALDRVDMTIREGDSFAFPAQALVRFWNEGLQPCEVIWVVAPATV